MRDARSCPPPRTPRGDCRRKKKVLSRGRPRRGTRTSNTTSPATKCTSLAQRTTEKSDAPETGRQLRRHSPQKETEGQHPLARSEPTCLGSSPALSRAPKQPEGPCRRQCQRGSQKEPPKQKGTGRPHVVEVVEDKGTTSSHLGVRSTIVNRCIKQRIIKPDWTSRMC